MYRAIPSLILYFSLYGCAGNHYVTSDGKCLTCFNNPITGMALNHDNDINYSTTKNTTKTEKFNLEVMQIPYIAYIRLNNNMGLGKPIKIYDSEKWERNFIKNTATPYVLKGVISHAQYKSVYVDIVIEPSPTDQASSNLTIKYANKGAYVKAPVSLGTSLGTRILGELQKPAKKVPNSNYYL